MSSYDIVIKGGTVIDGSGAPARRADVGIVGDRIAQLGDLAGASAARTIDAQGRLVTPGFVDIHSHLDAQVSWDPACTSSCWHGITSVVFGNCGVTFAPVKPTDHDYLAKMMESVEDVPAASIMAGLPWDWETYGGYLDSVERMGKGINVGGLVGHCAVRIWAMGERSIDKGCNPTAEELSAMVGIVDEAMAAGALGFSTSRTLAHRVPDGRPVPGTWAEPAELLALAEPLRRRGRGVFEAAPRFEKDGPDFANSRAEIDWMAEVSIASGRPVTFGLAQSDLKPDLYRKVIEFTEAGNARGARMRPQTTTRGIGVLFGLQARTPFDRSPAWRRLRDLPLAEKLAVVAQPERRAELLAEAAANGPGASGLERFYLLVGPDADYVPNPAKSLPALAAARGVSVAEAFLDLSVETAGRALFNYPLINQSLAAVEDMITNPLVALGLADSGAHVGQIMDASQPTWFLTHWVRDRQRFTIEEAIRRLSSDTAGLFGVVDRGLLEPGRFADVNVIDFDALRLPPPEFVHDFPGGAGRFVQRASGYDCTIVNGQVFMEGGEHTGALAGQVLRSGPDER
ncbi:MAG: N-acyl-D-amino-acid deacylase family protein [Acidimicrobiales bacterium]